MSPLLSPAYVHGTSEWISQHPRLQPRVTLHIFPDEQVIWDFQGYVSSGICCYLNQLWLALLCYREFERRHPLSLGKCLVSWYFGWCALCSLLENTLYRDVQSFLSTYFPMMSSGHTAILLLSENRFVHFFMMFFLSFFLAINSVPVCQTGLHCFPFSSLLGQAIHICCIIFLLCTNPL